MDCRNAKLDAENFNPRSPHGERHGDLHELDYPLKFQSTLPARGATRRAVQNKSPRQFQSTLPARGATYRAKATAARMKHFNPRSPHGERLQGIFSRRSSSTISIHAPRTGSDCSTSSVPSSPIRFQSTLPARGATFVAVFRERGDLISIHAPRTGSDQSATRRAGAGAYFNPRSPHGERRHRGAVMFSRFSYFNPRSPHGERRPTRRRETR